MTDNIKPPAVRELELQRGRPFDHYVKMPAKTYHIYLVTRGIDGKIKPEERTLVLFNNRARLSDGDIAVWTTVNGTLIYWTGRASPHDLRSFLTVEETWVSQIHPRLTVSTDDSTPWYQRWLRGLLEGDE